MTSPDSRKREKMAVFIVGTWCSLVLVYVSCRGPWVVVGDDEETSSSMQTSTKLDLHQYIYTSGTFPPVPFTSTRPGSSLLHHCTGRQRQQMPSKEPNACMCSASDKEAANIESSVLLKQRSLSPKHTRCFAQWPVRPVCGQSSHPPCLSRIVAASNARRRTSGAIVWPFRPFLPDVVNLLSPSAVRRRRL